MYASVFPDQHALVAAGESISTQPRDFKCLRKVNELLDTHCGANGEYALTYQKYVANFCETASDEKKELIEGVIYQVCGVFE